MIPLVSTVLADGQSPSGLVHLTVALEMHCNIPVANVSKQKQGLVGFCAFACHFGDKAKKWAIILR
jgi:hypothetical protein